MSLLAFLRTVFWIAVGITAHDIASVEGFHVPGVHAFYFSVPIALFCLIVMAKRKYKWGQKTGF